jgi:hypothetical protein
MKTWIYAAADSRAGAAATYALAERHGIVWRSFYADRQPPQAIPRARDLRPGDTLYLAYRCGGGRLQVLGRMRLGRADLLCCESPVFVEVPAVLVPEFRRHGYEVDPVLRKMVGIFVEEVEPLCGELRYDKRNALSELQEDPFGAVDVALPVSIAPEARRAAAPAAVSGGPFATKRAVAVPVAAIAGSGARADGIYVGVDVGGRPEKGFDLCFVDWRSGAMAHVEFVRVPHRSELPPTSAMRPLIWQGNLRELSRLTIRAAAPVAKDLWGTIVRHAPEVRGVFIDSPSGFSRNILGHGRLTEKQSLLGVSFQSTPSIACGREHGGDWAWLVYGMAAHLGCVRRGEFSEAEWLDGLTRGCSSTTQPTAPGLITRECFPTATISRLRVVGRQEDVVRLLGPWNHLSEVDAVSRYLEHGVSAAPLSRS